METMTPQQEAITISERLRQLLSMRGYRMQDITDVLPVSASAITRRFQQGKWSVSELAAVCAWLDVPMTALVDQQAFAEVFGNWTPPTTPGGNVVSMRTRRDQGVSASGWIEDDLEAEVVQFERQAA